MTKEKDAEAGGTFLVGYAGRLFCVQGDFQVAERTDGFDACGCGESYALGAMACLPEMEPRARLTRALEMAAHFSAGVRGPFVFQEA
jgi:ATP-dependent protease HslVU (ClpYQ) peptidase subunit